MPKFASTVSLFLKEHLHLYDGKKEYKICIRESFFDEGFDYVEAITLVKPLLENPENKLILFGKKNFKTELFKFGINLKASCEDVLIQKYLADFSGKEENLLEVIEEYSLPTDYPAFSLWVIFEKIGAKAKSKKA